MRMIAFTALLASSLAVELAERLRFPSTFSTLADAAPGSIPDSYLPLATPLPNGQVRETLDLRHAHALPLHAAEHAAVDNPVAPAPVPPVNPAAPHKPEDPAKGLAPAAPPVTTTIATTTTSAVVPKPPDLVPLVPLVPGAAPVNPAAIPPAVLPAVPSPAGPAPAPEYWTTVQWVETKMGTTRSWFPVTVTLHNQAFTGTVPQPGVGEIGLGTLTGRVGVTRTVLVGAARTAAPDWKVGAAAVVGVGVGIAGLV